MTRSSLSSAVSVGSSFFACVEAGATGESAVSAQHMRVIGQTGFPREEKALREERVSGSVGRV